MQYTGKLDLINTMTWLSKSQRPLDQYSCFRAPGVSTGRVPCGRCQHWASSVRLVSALGEFRAAGVSTGRVPCGRCQHWASSVRPVSALGEFRAAGVSTGRVPCGRCQHWASSVRPVWALGELRAAPSTVQSTLVSHDRSDRRRLQRGTQHSTECTRISWQKWRQKTSTEHFRSTRVDSHHYLTQRVLCEMLACSTQIMWSLD